MKLTTTIYCAKSKTIKEYESMGMDIPDEVYDMEKKLGVDLADVCAVAEAIENDKINPEKATIYLRSGESFMIGTPFAEVMEKWTQKNY